MHAFGVTRPDMHASGVTRQDIHAAGVCRSSRGRHTPAATVNVTSKGMSCLIECHTEQYYSFESSIARATFASGTSPVTV